MQSFLGLFIVGDDGSRLACLTSSAEIRLFRPGDCARVAHLEERVHPATLAASYLFGFTTEEDQYLTLGQLQHVSKLRLRVEDCNTVYHDSPAALDHVDLVRPSGDELDTNRASIESCLARCGPGAVRTAVLGGLRAGRVKLTDSEADHPKLSPSRLRLQTPTVACTMQGLRPVRLSYLSNTSPSAPTALLPAVGLYT